MKKAILILLIFPTAVFSQIKIGDITVPDSIGNAFLVWCYKNPIVKYLKYPDYGPTGVYSTEYMNRINKEVEEYNESIKAQSIRKKNYTIVCDTMWCNGGPDTFGNDWTGKYHDATGRKINIYKPPKYIYILQGYYILRKPTESEFLKYLSKKHKS